MPRAWIGTSGWNYRDWRGTFYPQRLRQADWLEFYAGRFETVEINNSFYRIPRPEMIGQWLEQSPSRFRFSVKLWRGITQFRKLRNTRDFVSSFFAAIGGLPKRQRGPVLVQLPPQLGPDLDRLDAFLAEVREVTAPERWKVAVEFRHEGWLRDEVYKLLDRHRAALCLHDMPGRAPTDQPNDASFVYVRRHGPSGRYRDSYTHRQLADDARRIRRWLREGRTVYVYYNNDVQGHAVRNAQALQEILETRPLAKARS